MTKKRKLKHTSLGLAGPDDPIFREGVTFYTRPSDRISTRPRIGSQVILNPKRKPPAKPKEDANE